MTLVEHSQPHTEADSLFSLNQQQVDASAEGGKLKL